MKTFQRVQLSLSICFAIQLLHGGLACPAQDAESLEHKVARGLESGLMQASAEGRKDLIPNLEKWADISEDDASAAQVHGATVRFCAQVSLAKLGVQKYFDQFVECLANPTTTKEYKNMRGRDQADIAVQVSAMEAFMLINDKAAVKWVAPFLYNTNLVALGDLNVPPPSFSQFAAGILSSMNLHSVPSPPNKEYGLQEMRRWQQWWEKHKDYYEKLEFGQTPSSEITMNRPARVVSAMPKQSNLSSAKHPAVTSEEKNNSSQWLIGILVALAALVGGAVLWRAKHRDQ
jgi:hypothetical protein